MTTHPNHNTADQSGADVDKLRMQWLLRQIVGALPGNRDWLDPSLEKEAKFYGWAALASTQPAPKRHELNERNWRLALAFAPVPVLYVDEINGDQTCRDDLWLATTDQLATPQPFPAPAVQSDIGKKSLTAARKIRASIKEGHQSGITIQRIIYEVFSTPSVQSGDDARIACSSCGLTMGESKTLAAIAQTAPAVAGEAITRKAFICQSCEGVYADQPVTACDCTHEKTVFIEGAITYAAPSQGAKQ